MDKIGEHFIQIRNTNGERLKLQTIIDYMNKSYRKYVFFLWLLTMVFIFIVGATLRLDIQNTQEQNKQLLINDSIIINHYLYSDSLYREHLRECSFISNKQIKVGYNDYLQYVQTDKLK